MVRLPSEIGELTNLEQLIVHNNNLTILPEEIGKMTALKHISIGDNDLSSLPEEIMNLTNLETIELQNNNFTDENVKKWTDRFSNTKCKISFSYQQGNISEPIYVEMNIKGGSPEDSFLEIYLNSKDGDMVSNIFHWSSSASDEDDLFSSMMANSRYNKISANEGLNAIDSEGNIVPVNIGLNAETPSTEDELIQWVKLTYIQTCNEHNLKPNSKLSLVSVGSSGNKKTLKMMEL